MQQWSQSAPTSFVARLSHVCTTARALTEPWKPTDVQDGDVNPEAVIDPSAQDKQGAKGEYDRHAHGEADAVAVQLLLLLLEQNNCSSHSLTKTTTTTGLERLHTRLAVFASLSEKRRGDCGCRRFFVVGVSSLFAIPISVIQQRCHFKKSWRRRRLVGRIFPVVLCLMHRQHDDNRRSVGWKRLQ